MQAQSLSMAWCMVVWLGMAVLISSQCFPDEKEGCGKMDKSSPDDLAKQSMDFAVDLFKTVTKPPTLPSSKNCHISPVSVRIGLLLTYLGARGNTKTEMKNTLRFTNTKQADILNDYQQLRAAIVHNATEAANYTVRIAGKLYLDNNFKLRQCMLDLLTSEVQQVDFRSSPEPSRQLINKWVEDQTNNKIVGLLPEGSIKPDTLMVIVNAIYLKAAWQRIFDPLRTSDADFFIEPQNRKKVKMMSLRPSSFPYATSSKLDCTAVELPYSGGNVSMVILLPNSNAQDLISKLTTDNLKEVFSSLKPTPVALSVPKFKLDQAYDLTEPIKSMGIKDLFSSVNADLSGFTGNKGIFAAFLKHKSFIEVNEGGTEAAAATAIGFEPTSVVVGNKVFNANRPFLFIIRYIKYNAILFMGLVSDPTLEN